MISLSAQLLAVVILRSGTYRQHTHTQTVKLLSHSLTQGRRPEVMVHAVLFDLPYLARAFGEHALNIKHDI